MEKQLSTRQACILLFISIVIGKIMILPSIINYISSNDTWIVFLMAFCVDFFFCLLLLPFVTKQEQNFFVAVKNKAGKFVAYLVAVLLFVLFGFKAFDLLAQNFCTRHQAQVPLRIKMLIGQTSRFAFRPKLQAPNTPLNCCRCNLLTAVAYC